MAKKKAPAPKPEPLKPLSYSLDAVDTLKIENMVLKERNFQLEKEKAHNELYTGLAKKYRVNLELFDLTIDARNKKINLTPK